MEVFNWIVFCSLYNWNLVDVDLFYVYSLVEWGQIFLFVWWVYVNWCRWSR